jgi:hypothetical protein
MVKKIEAHKWSTTFEELWSNEARTLDIQQYDICLNEWKAAHEKKMIKNYLLMIVLFCAGLWAVSQSAYFMAVLLLAFAGNFNLKSAHHGLMSEIMASQGLLAMLINRQSQEIEALRDQVTRKDES